MTPPDRKTARPASEDPNLRRHEADVITGEGDEEAVSVISFSVNQIIRVRDLLGRLYGARRTVRFYPAGHPAVEESIGGLMGVIDEYHQEGTDIPLAFFEDEMLLGEQILPEDSVIFDQLIRDMVAIGAGSITFERGLDTEELFRAVEVLASDPTDVARAGGLHRLIERAALSHVTIGAVKILDHSKKSLSDEPAWESYGSALDLLRDLEMALRTQRSFPVGQTKSVVRSMVEHVLENRFAMLELAGLKDFDEYTFYHSVNVTILSLSMGARITEDRRFLNALGAGALMHDVGKMTIERYILNKPGALTGEEWAEIRLHPVHGAEIVVTMPGMDKASVVVILEHHMGYDGRGYPNTNTPPDQHLASRIVAVADAYDAMTSHRAYSAARLPDDAMGVLVDNAGSSFDPALVRLFVRMMGIYPPRSVVRLDTGEVGIVIRPGDHDLALPKVRVISSPDGTVIDPFDVDLADDSSEGRTIEACLDPASLNVDVGDYI